MHQYPPKLQTIWFIPFFCHILVKNVIFGWKQNFSWTCYSSQIYPFGGQGLNASHVHNFYWICLISKGYTVTMTKSVHVKRNMRTMTFLYYRSHFLVRASEIWGGDVMKLPYHWLVTNKKRGPRRRFENVVIICWLVLCQIAISNKMLLGCLDWKNKFILMHCWVGVVMVKMTH